jgi:DNA-binding NtrC family response regulator
MFGARASGTPLAVENDGIVVNTYRALVAVPGMARSAATRDVFTRAGFDAVAVTTFEDAVSCLRESRPDLLATEIRLGDFNGLHLALRAHALYPDLPILVMGTDHEGGEAASAFGATFLSASGGDDALIEAASDLVGGRKG